LKFRVFWGIFLSVFFWALLIAGLYLASRYSYLLFHSLVEVFIVVVVCSIFMIAWNARKFMDNNYFLFLGISSLFYGLLVIFHVLSYTGMGVFAGYGTDLPTQLWISSRYLQSLSLLVAPLFFKRKFYPRLAFSGYAFVCLAILLATFHLRIFPICYVEGEGLTPFKVVSEYIIAFILLLSIVPLALHRKQLDRKILRLLLSFIILSVAAGLSFTLYTGPYGAFNFLGHILMLVSFYLLYRALINTALKQPYGLLFRNLKQNEEALRESEVKYRQLSEHLEEKVEQKVAELQIAQRLAAIGQMVSVVAHEVRNPLQNIRFGVDAIRREVGDNPQVGEILEEIQYGVGSLDHIVAELLDYSRPASLRVTPGPIGEVIRRALNALSDKLQGIEVQLALEQESREVLLDAPKMVRVFVNLFTNAVQAMSGKGTILIQSRFNSQDGRNFLHVTITDNGTGIKPDDLNQIFEPFFTTKTQGVGLGISICRKIIEAHHGSISFQSQWQEGTTVEISLPAQ
jgi:signal transduction histidine kinase